MDGRRFLAAAFAFSFGEAWALRTLQRNQKLDRDRHSKGLRQEEVRCLHDRLNRHVPVYSPTTRAAATIS